MYSGPRKLPIHRHLPGIEAALASARCAVVQAPPGAGKTTRVPLALLDQPWLKNRKILLLEPRRLAARSCAAHMAALLNEPVGRTVGYQVRLDRKIGPETRIEVITEGIFTRKIQEDPFLEGIVSLKQLAGIDLEGAVFSLVSWKQQQRISHNASTHITVPSGSKKPLTYCSDKGILDSPVLAVRLQEMFGLAATPRIAGNTIPVTLHLLSPAGRPVQITSDLENFWTNTYREVKKDLMGRYPKHYWPDDPLAAMPTSRAKPRKS